MSILIPNETELENLDEPENANSSPLISGPSGSLVNSSLSEFSDPNSQKIFNKTRNDVGPSSNEAYDPKTNEENTFSYTSNPSIKRSSFISGENGLGSSPFSSNKQTGMDLLPPPSLALLTPTSNQNRVNYANLLPSPVPKPSYPKEKHQYKDNERLKITEELSSSDDLLLETPTENIPQSFDFNFSSSSINSNDNAALDSGSYLNSGLDSAAGFESGNIIQYTASGFFTFPESVASGPINLQETSMPNLSDIFLSHDIMTPLLIEGGKSNLPPKCCEGCSRPIEGTGYFVNNCFYHKECLICSICGKSSLNFVNFRNKTICVDCMDKLTDESKCHGCGSIVLKDGITVCGHLYHPGCISCGFCRKPITDPKSATQAGDLLSCPNCLPKLEKRKCRKCGEVVADKYVKHAKMYFHVDHFRCCMCDELLIGRNYICHHNRFYCPKHGAPFYENCAFCKRRFLGPTDDRALWTGKMYHPACFGCRVCGKPLKPSRAIRSIYGRPHCKQCYTERCNEGDVGDTGKRTKKVIHNPDSSKSRRAKFQQKFNVEPPYEPEYISKPTVEHAKKIVQTYAPDIDNMTQFV